jgi:hypothetical protein
MAPKCHPTPLSGGDRKALTKELGKSRAMANMLAAQSVEMRVKGEAMIQQADKLLCESWNERMWSDGEPIDPSPTIDQAINGGFPWLEIRCARCKTPSDVDLAAMPSLVPPPAPHLCHHPNRAQNQTGERNPTKNPSKNSGEGRLARHSLPPCPESAPGTVSAVPICVSVSSFQRAQAGTM